MRIALALMLVGCGGEGKSLDGLGGDACLFENVLDRDVPSSAVQCGKLGVQATDTERMAARTCVGTALGDNRTFVVAFDIQGIDSRVARAYYGTGSPLELRAVFYDGDPGGGGGEGRPSATTTKCGALVATTPCDSEALRTTLCFQCMQGTTVDTCSSL